MNVDIETLYQTRVARFFLVQHTKTGEKLTKLPKNIPNYHKIYQRAVKYIPKFSIKRPSKTYKNIWIFGMQIYHLATLYQTLEEWKGDGKSLLLNWICGSKPFPPKNAFSPL
jgi:hypothetical protein